MSTKLSGTSILILGGTSGIGYAVASLLAQEANPPSRIILSSSNPTRVQQAIQRLKSAHPSTKTEITGHACDLSNLPSVSKDVSSLLETCTAPTRSKKLDHIIFTAGGLSPKSTSGESVGSIFSPLAQIDPTTVAAHATVKVYAPLAIGRLLAQSHAEGNGLVNPGPQSSLTLTSGTVGDVPMPNAIAGSIMASGLQGMTRGMALELSKYPVSAAVTDASKRGPGTRVNLVNPGAVQTELWDAWRGAMGEQGFQAWLAKARGMLPTGEVGQPEDVAESYLGAIKDWNNTGTMITSDGGAFLKGPEFL